MTQGRPKSKTSCSWMRRRWSSDRALYGDGRRYFNFVLLFLSMSCVLQRASLESESVLSVGTTVAKVIGHRVTLALCCMVAGVVERPV